MRNRNLVTEEERKRILQMHQNATKKQYLKETMDEPLDFDLDQLEQEVKNVSSQTQLPEPVVAGSVCYAENPKEVAGLQKLSSEDKSKFEKIMDYFSNKSFGDILKTVKNLLSQIKKKKSEQKEGEMNEQGGVMGVLSIMIPGVNVSVGVALAVLVVIGLISAAFRGKSGGSRGKNWACRNKSAIHNWVRRGF